MRSALTLLVASALALGVSAQPARAHAGVGADASNYETRLLDVTPSLDGLEVRVIEGGSRMELTNLRRETVTVFGYELEPYLRVGPDGVHENLRSPATYLNRDRLATTDVPDIADSSAEPEWRKVSDDRTARWHDHRVHWMGKEDPPAIKEAPGRRHTIREWEVPLLAGRTEVSVTGTLLWVPGPSPWPWYLLAGALLLATVGLAAAPAWRGALGAAVAGVVAVDIVHVVAVALGTEAAIGEQLGQLVAGSAVSALGWVAGVAAVVLLVRRHPDAPSLAAFAGAMVAANGGLRDAGELSRSQIVAAGPDALVRGAIAVSIGIGLGLVGAAVVRYRKAMGIEGASPSG